MSPTFSNNIPRRHVDKFVTGGTPSQHKFTREIAVSFTPAGCDDKETVHPTVEMTFQFIPDCSIGHGQYDEITLLSYTPLKDDGIVIEGRHGYDLVEEWLFDDGYDDAVALARSERAA